MADRRWEPIGFALAAVAAWLWIAGSVWYGSPLVGWITTLSQAIALTAAASVARRGSLRVGRAVAWAAAGAVIFTVWAGAADGFWPGNVLYALGLVGMGFFGRDDAKVGEASTSLSASAGLAALGALWWVVWGAATGPSVWLVFNVLMSAGLGLVAVGAFANRERAAATTA